MTPIMRYPAAVALWMMIVILHVPGAAADAGPCEPTGVLLSQVTGPAASPSEPGVDSSSALPVEPRVRPGEALTNSPEQPRKSCPKSAYINCMPPVPRERRPFCSREYLQWVKGHCPGVMVVY
jgi:hypothetical protein